MRNPTDGEEVRALRAAGLRVTATRVAAMRALAAEPHATTETVIRLVRADLGTVSPQAVYNVLASLLEAGLVRRIEPAGSVPLYERRVADNHHHVVCRRCGAVADVDCAVGARPCLTPSETHGYLLDEAEVTYWGLCPACQAAGHTAASTQRRSGEKPPATPSKRGPGRPGRKAAPPGPRDSGTTPEGHNEQGHE